MATEPVRNSEEGEVSTKELILNIQNWARYFWSKWMFLLIVGILGGLIGLWYSYVKQPLYTATTTLVLESGDSKGGLGRFAGVAAIAGIDLGGQAGGLFQGDNILELYKSRTMLIEALLTNVHPDSNELLIERYLEFSGMQESWGDRSDLLGLDFRIDPVSLDSKTRRLRDSVMTIIAGNIQADLLTVKRPEKDLSIVRVDMTSPDEIFSKAFNESLVREVNKFYINTKTKKLTDNIAILQYKADSVRSVMEGAIYLAVRASDATPNLNPTRQTQRIVPAQEAQFSAETNKSILAQLVQNLEITKMTLLQEEPLIQLIDQPVFPLKVERLGRLKGIIIGGFAAGFLALIYFILIKRYRDIMNE